ncbi:MAG TPA: STN domain-containing protein, partial [Flavitalea sp.]|nr:STN domain-containing protein [Flavitalea sp.]
MSFYPKMHGGMAAGIYIARAFHHQVNDRKMKLFFMRVMTLAFLLTLNGVLLAAGSSGQDLSKTRLSIDLRDVSLKTALKRIEGSTSYSFSFRTADISSAGRVSLSAKDISLEKLLSELFSSAGLSYEVINSNIIIKKNKPSTGVESENILDNGGIRGR